MLKMLAKDAFLNGSRGNDHRLEQQGKWLIVRLLVQFGNIQYRQQTSLRIEDRRARATQPGVTAAKMVGTMHQNRPSIRDAGADAVCAFLPLRPDATQPYTPLLELAVLALVAAMVDGDSIAVAQENHIRLRANNGIEAVYLLLGSD